MNILVTAGNTWTLIDKVRCITNIFTGKTGAAIARCALQRGHQVTLLTSHPETVAAWQEAKPLLSAAFRLRRYQTFDDLEQALAEEVQRPALDAVIHAAAVSDYRPAGIFAPTAQTRFCSDSLQWTSTAAAPPALLDVAAGKIKSDAPELWLRLVRTPKLVDRIRSDWKFAGILVKFKLEVDISEERLLTIAEHSRRQSQAELMVANTLEGATSWAYLGPLAGRYERIARRDLAERLLQAVEQLHQERQHG